MRCVACRLQGLNPLGCHQKRPQSDVSQGGALLGDSSTRSGLPVSALSLCLAENMFPDRIIDGENKIT